MRTENVSSAPTGASMRHAVDDLPGGCFERDQAVGVEIGAMAAADEIGRADEIRDEGVARKIVDVARRADLLDQPVAHHHDAVRHRQRLFEIVRHVDRRDAEPVLQLAQLDAHVGAQLGVEVRQRLVEQQHRGLEHEGARQRDALLLPAGELRRAPRCEAAHLHHVERAVDLLGDLRGLVRRTRNP